MMVEGSIDGGVGVDRGGIGTRVHMMLRSARAYSVDRFYWLASPSLHCTSFLFSLFALLPCRADARSEKR